MTTALHSLPVLNDSALSPNWRYISGQALFAYEDYKQARPYERLRKARLLTPPGANTKLAKGSIPIYGLTLAPAGMSGYQLCPWRSPECEAACLGKTAGRSRFSNVQEARIAKTKYLMEHPYEFFRQLYEELQAASMKHSFEFAFRSNVLSDIPWEKIAPQLYDFAEWNYDYTKSFKRAMDSLNTPLAYHLTLSYSGHNYEDCIMYLNAGGNVAVVFAGDLPERHWGVPVINGDLNDARFLDPVGGCIVGLKAKGKIDLDSPFVVTV